MEKIKKLDAFGITPKLFVNNKEKYQTKFGLFLTLLLFGCVIVSCWVYGRDIYYKQNPQITFSEQVTQGQEKYVMNKNTFNFGVSIQNPKSQHYIDESIYTVKIIQNIVKNTILLSGELQQEFIVRDLEARRCTLEDFQLDTEYFSNLGYVNDLYCPGVDEYFIQGDWGQPEFSSINVQFFPCKNYLDDEETIPNPVKCQSEDIIKETLADNYWAFYYTDQILDPTRFENPFEYTGRDSFGLAEQNMYKKVDFYFRNVFLQDNVGIIFDSFQQKKGLQFSIEKELNKNSPQKSGEFLRVAMRFEKVKESKVYRNYLNLAEVIAKVGGVLKVLLIFFMILSWIISQKFYDLQLVNQVFSFENQENLENQKEKDSENNNGKNQNSKKLEFDFIIKAFIPCSKKNKQKKQQLDFAINQLGNYLNLHYILTKLVEIEKLKMLLLNEDQQKIFNYIPKPTIKMDLVQQHQKNQDIIDSQYSNNISPQNFNELDEIQDKFNGLLLLDQIPQKLQNEQAYEAFKSLSKNQKKKLVDCKILHFMDKEMYNNFEQQLGEKVVIELKQKTNIQHQNFKQQSQIFTPQDESKQQSNKKQFNNQIIKSNDNSQQFILQNGKNQQKEYSKTNSFSNNSNIKKQEQNYDIKSEESYQSLNLTEKNDKGFLKINKALQSIDYTKLKGKDKFQNLNKHKN